MKKVLLSALVAGSLFVPLANSEAAYAAVAAEEHVVTDAMAENKVVARKHVVQERRAPQIIGSTATARTDRSLINEAAPKEVIEGNTVKNIAEATMNEIQPYRMRSGDQVQLIVYGHEDLSNRTASNYIPYVVRTDGNLTLPLIGDVNVNNRTVDNVTKEISERLAEYIIDPQVTMNIIKLGTTRVYVLGQVRQQGALELDKSHTLLDAVGKAGGFTNKSAKKKVYVVRNGADKFACKVNLLDVLKGGDTSLNIELNEGDCVYISSNHKLAFNQVAAAMMQLSEVPYYIKRTRNL